MQETKEMQVRSLGQEDHLENEMATHSSILAWRIPWTEETGGLQSMGSKESSTNIHPLIVPQYIDFFKKLKVCGNCMLSDDG